MPLLTSPIDGSPMKQINRFGIELDICPTSGGVWLDKGELEKLIQFIQESAEEDARHFASAKQGKADYDDNYYRREPQRKYSDDDYRRGHYKKKSGMSRIMDLFDF
ncbi:TFIIB-type zinc ribbon-containing protein [Thorsellia kenyensis]|uniref:Zf-TFIIB domain-containing protein n=1 Tax=Thorsellia kenyensis TaxID=1549888 RepID=A0ABV6C6M3_9GAMM